MKALFLFISIITVATIGIGGNTYAANPLEEACSVTSKSKDKTSEASACQVDETKNPISGGTDSLLFKISVMVSALAGSIAVIMMIVAGISMMTAGGDSQKFGNARNTVIFAAVGLIIIAIAQSLISFVIIKATTP